MIFGMDLGFTWQIIIAVVSMFVLVFGAEEVVERMTSVAVYFGIPDVLIAMSVISIGTSLPEIASHLTASFGILSGSLSYEIASATVLGANIGSDVVQQTLVVGVVILISIIIGSSGEFEFSKEFLEKDYLPMIGTTLMCMVLGWDGIYSRLDGMVLFGTFLSYMWFLFKTRGHRMEHNSEPSDNIVKDITIGLGGMALVLVSAHIILKATETVVAVTGLGGSVIGVASLGVISALPEMMTAIQGLRHKAEGISLGTLIGSNITNPLVAIGGGALISTYWVPRPLVLWDLPMETFTAAALLVYLLFFSDRKLGWKGGLYLVSLYIFYLAIRFTYFAVD